MRFSIIKPLLWPTVVVITVILVALTLRSRPQSPVSTHRGQVKSFQLVSRIRGESKLVVATQAMTVQLDRANSLHLFNLLYLGKTAVKLRVDDCRIQYYIPGGEVRMEDFRFDPAARRLVATLPYPVLDESMIDVPSDPARWWVYKASGWARFDKNRMEKEARTALQARVLEVASCKGYDSGPYVMELERHRVDPHTAMRSGVVGGAKGTSRRLCKNRPAIGARERMAERIGSEGYRISQRCRKKIEEAFGWIKTVAGLARTRLVGRWKILQQMQLAAAAYNLVRLRKMAA